MKRLTVKQILKAVNNSNVSLYGHYDGQRSLPEYYYFVYDDIKNNKYETVSVNVMRLSDLPIDHWVAIANDLIVKYTKPV